MENDAVSVSWFALRDLSRIHTNTPAYKVLAEKGVEVFTPLTNRVRIKRGKRIGREEPVIIDLLFARSTREILDPILAKLPNVQYRYSRGSYCKPIIVNDMDMNRFRDAVARFVKPDFFGLDEITPSMIGEKVRIIGGELDGVEGHILTVKGSKYKRLMVELPNYIVATTRLINALVEPVK